MSGAKSVLDIEVRDQAFKDFQALFTKYQDAVKALPGDWGKVGQAMGLGGVEIEALAAGAAGVAAEAERAETAHEKIAAAATRTDRSMHALVGSTKDVAKNIKGATEQLLKWVGVGSVMSGLLGAGGIWGIDRLAMSAAGSRRTAQGVGTTPGQQQAFGINYSRFVNPDTLMGNVADAQTDQSKWWAFSALGMDPRKASQEDPAELSAELVRRGKQTWDQGNGTQQYAEAHGLLEFFGMQDLRRLHAASGQDVDDAEGRFGKDAAKFKVSDKDLKNWQDFTVQLGRAGQTIETSFIRALSPLAPELTQLSDAFSGVITALLSNPHIKEWTNDVASGLGQLAAFLKKEDINADFNAFVDDVKWAGREAKAAWDWFEAHNPFHVDPKAAPGTLHGPLQRDGEPSSWLLRIFPNLVPDTLNQWQKSAITVPLDQARTIEDQAAVGLGVPQEVERWLFRKEGGLNPDGTPRVNSSSGAIGAGQLMPATARALHVDPYDTASNIYGSMKNLRDQFNRFGSWDKALAAYNMKPSELADDIKAHPIDWQNYLPDETKKYIAGAPSGAEDVASHIRSLANPRPVEVAGAPGGYGGGSGGGTNDRALADEMKRLRRQMATQGQPVLTVQNQTGGSAVITGSQLGHNPGY